jgi:ATP-dependent Clp protease ATP-binding subunit ClpC
VILNAVEESHELNQNYVGTEHLLLGLLREKNGVAAKALSIVGVKLEAARQKVIEVRNNSPEAPPG